MRTFPRAILLCCAVCLAWPNATRAQGDDWSVRRSGFDPRLVNRYKALLHRRPNDGYALAKLIKLYKQHRSMGALVAEYRRRANKNPRNFAFQVIAGHLCRRKGQKGQAIAFYERATKLRPKSPSVPAALGALYRRTGQQEKAVAAYKRALSLSRSKRQKKRYLRALANIALAKRDLAGARAYFKKLVQLTPRSVFLRIELAQSLARAKLHAEAIAQYRKILARTSNTATRAGVLKEIGALQHKLGKTKEAVATYRKAMRLAARGNWIRRELTDRIISIYREKEDLKSLIAYYQKTWKRRDHFEWQVLGRLYDETGDEARAMKAYRSALKKQPRAIDTRVRLIALLERSDHGKDVIAEYRKLARMASGEPKYQLELAKRLHRSGRQAEALKVLARAGRRFRRDAAVHSAMADLYARWGHQKLALREARILVRIEPRDDSHLVNLGEQYFLRGQKKKAVEIWKRLIVAIPQRHRAYAKLASIYGDHDMTQPAVELYKKAIKLKPKLIAYQRALALLLERKRRHSDALASWAKVLDLARIQKARQTLREARTHTIDILHQTYRLRHRIRQHEQTFRTPPAVGDAKARTSYLDAGFFIAEAYRKKRDLKRAAKTYETILAYDKSNIEALVALEAVYRDRHHFAKAVALLKRLARLQPKRRKEYFQRIASLLLLLYNDKEALIYAHKAVALGQQDARSYQRLGELYEKKEDSASAIVAYKKALALNAHRPGVHFALARLFTRQGKYLEAEKTYRKLVRTGRTPEVVRRAFRKGVVLSSYLGKLEKLEKELIPLAVRATQLAETYRKILVRIYQRRVPLLIYQARQGNPKTRRRARAALAKIGIRGMAPLLEELANPQLPASRRHQLIRMLGYLGNPNAVLPLLRLAEKEPQQPAILIYANRASYHLRYRYRLRHRYRHGSYRRRGVDQRVEATIAVGRLADPRAVPGLVRLMGSREGALREAAAWALSQLRGRKVQRALFAALGDSRSTVQMMACAGLGIQRDRRMRPVLEEVMLDGQRNERVRAACAWGLGALGDTRSTDSLLRALGSGYDRLQRCAAWALGSFRAKSAMPVLVQALWSRKPRVRTIMLWALMGIAEDGKQQRASRPPDVQVKWGRIDRDQFIDRLTDTAERVEAAALARTLATLGSKHAEPLSKGVRTALTRHRDIVLRVLRDLDSSPRTLTLGPLTAGRAALDGVTRKRLDATIAALAVKIQPAVLRLLSHRDPLVRQRAASVLVKLRAHTGGGQATGLATELAKKGWRVRVSAYKTLARCATCRRGLVLLPSLMGSIKTRRPWTEREAAVRLLGLLGAAATPVLGAALRDPNGFVREAAAQALGETGGGLASTLIARALRDRLAEVRVAAVASARRLGSTALRAQLERLRSDPSRKVRDAVRKALGGGP
ncbi:MAG: hypothetical protein CSA65_03125 [Proteobacteria bacterium]|nr:MAG: hypothetical protein CSB49_04210 [Pseudomonadota bacterium]PIE19128.1 MAG: hypothetical protein CSA65_03125 [Pseudomonadota bacterium]